MKKNNRFIFVALCAALISAGCFIQIPLPGGVPIVVQDMFAILSGLLLGPVYGTAAVLVFLLLGCIGLPVFSGKAGVYVILSGPTGGFLVGYVLAALAAGIIVSAAQPLIKTGCAQYRVWIIMSIAAIAAALVVFASGVIGFMRIMHVPLVKAAALVVVPFIPGNVIKIIISVMIAKRLRPVTAQYLS